MFSCWKTLDSSCNFCCSKYFLLKTYEEPNYPPVGEQQVEVQPDTQESSGFSFSAHHSSLHHPAVIQLHLAVEAVAVLAHAFAPTAVAVSVAPLSCSLQELHCFPIAAEAAATAAPQVLAAFDARLPSLGASRANPVFV